MLHFHISTLLCPMSDDSDDDVILTVSKDGLKEAVDESVHVIPANDILSVEAPGEAPGDARGDARGDAYAGLSSSLTRCGKCVMCDGTTMTVNVRCLSGCDRDEIGMWWNIQTHPNIHRLFGVVGECDVRTIQNVFSPLHLPMGDDDHAHVHGESDRRSSSVVSVVSVALCEWKGKSLRMFLEERYGTDGTDGTDGEGLLFEEIVDLLLDISRGVQHLHARGYVHGNLTSHSILVEHSSQHDRYCAVVSDVGLWDRNGIDMSRGGGGDGIRWMAPELISSEEDEEGGMIGKRRSFASDVWAFGMVMSEMVNGNVPFSSRRALISVIFALGRGNELEMEVGCGFGHPLFRQLMGNCVLYDVPKRPFMTGVIQSLEEMR